MEGVGRNPDWRARLSQYVKSCHGKPLKPGSHDNFTFAGGCIGAVCSDDPARGLRGKYRSDASARRLFEGLGYADHVDCLIAGREEIPASRAQGGDLAVFPAERMVGVVSGGLVYLMTDQLVRVPMLDAKKFYRVT